MKPSKHNIDTGIMIEKYLSKHRIPKSSLGKDINRTGISVLRYTENFSIQTSILLDICHALEHNFFQEIADQLPTNFAVTKAPINQEKLSEHDIEIAQLKEQIKILEAEKAVLLLAFKRD
jgi:DNA-binding Xre family transcriptional regulator